MSIDLVLITYNRLDYTKKALESILADPSEKFNLYIFDNASKDGTHEYLKNEVKDPRIQDIILSKENIGQTAAVNKIWSKSKADLLGKLDNDCLVTPGWTRTLAQAHNDIDNLGVVACWHFFEDDFDYERAKHKIQIFGKHKIFRHPWTCGTGLLIKRQTYQKLGSIKSKATTQYWIKMAKAGYINGWYFPLVYQEHMDDPRSKHNRMRQMSFEEAYKYTGYQQNMVTDLKKYKQWHVDILENLLTGPYDLKYYTGWRKKWRGLKHKLLRLLQPTEK